MSALLLVLIENAAKIQKGIAAGMALMKAQAMAEGATIEQVAAAVARGEAQADTTQEAVDKLTAMIERKKAEGGEPS